MTDTYYVTFDDIEDPVIDTNLTSRNVSSSRIRFYATAEDNYGMESFTVFCGRTEYFSDDGNYEVRLEPGRNDIDLTAADLAGNIVHYNYNVNYHAPTSGGYIPPITPPVLPPVEPPVDPPVDPPVEPPVQPEHIIRLTIGNSLFSLDGIAYSHDVAPFIENGTTLVPLRFISEVLGAEVTWLADTKQVQILHQGHEIMLTIGSASVSVDGLPQELDVPAQLVNNRAFVPLRFISETLGADVDYDDAQKEITIRF